MTRLICVVKPVRTGATVASALIAASMTRWPRRASAKHHRGGEQVRNAHVDHTVVGSDLGRSRAPAEWSGVGAGRRLSPRLCRAEATQRPVTERSLLF